MSLKTRKISIVIIFLTFVAYSFAQQPAQYTQYIFNNYLMNPAVSGIENYTEIKLGNRNQWQGLKGAPVTSYVSVHAPIGSRYINSNINSFPANGRDPMSRSFVSNYRASEPHHGIGLYAIKDQAGPTSWLNLDLTYAYHIGINQSTNLSFGIAVGISQLQLDVTKITTGVKSDPAILANGNTQLQPDFAAGVWLYGRDYFAGLYARALLGKQNNTNGSLSEKALPPLFATAGYKFFISENIAVVPSTLVKFIAPNPITVDMNLKISFLDRFWIGGSYRRNDAISGMLGFSAMSLINVSYSYDYTTSMLNTESNGTHEIVLGLLLNNRYRGSSE